MKKKLLKFEEYLTKFCYEILFIALSLHLYGSIFFKDLHFYGDNIRIFNTIFLFLASINVFFNLKKITRGFIGFLTIFTFIINILFLFLPYDEILNVIRNSSFLIFFSLTLFNIFSFIKAPNRFDTSLISASAIGYLLIIEIAARILLILFSVNENNNLYNVDYSFHTNTFIDDVYYCTITVTSVGYGDVLPKSHTTKMFASILALIGQFYSIVVMSIMISKYLSKKNQN